MFSREMDAGNDYDAAKIPDGKSSFNHIIM
jgi:hypothetical protein